MNNIYGLGSDIANENRLKSILKKNKLFKKRIFSKSEILLCEKKKNSYEEDADPRTPKKIFQHLSRLRSTGQSEEAAVRRSNSD